MDDITSMIPLPGGEDRDNLIRYNIPAESMKELKQNKLEGEAWNQRTFTETPEEFIEQRVGGRDPKTGEEVMFDYVKQFYVIRMLNKWFPGWTIVDEKLWYQPEVRTWVMTGRLRIKYFSYTTMAWETREIPGVGALEVQFKKEGLDSSVYLPSKPDDMAKGTRTELIKNCAYILGIGMDIYEQAVTPNQKEQFEDILQHFEIKDHLIAVAHSINRRKMFDEFLGNIPNLERINKFKDMLKDMPEGLKGATEKFWLDFSKQNNKTADYWLNNLQSFINKKKGEATK